MHLAAKLCKMGYCFVCLMHSNYLSGRLRTDNNAELQFMIGPNLGLKMVEVKSICQNILLLFGSQMKYFVCLIYLLPHYLLPPLSSASFIFCFIYHLSLLHLSSVSFIFASFIVCLIYLCVINHDEKLFVFISIFIYYCCHFCHF